LNYNEEEVKKIIVEGVKAGRKHHDIANELNDAGFTTKKGGKFTNNSVCVKAVQWGYRTHRRASAR